MPSTASLPRPRPALALPLLCQYYAIAGFTYLDPAKFFVSSASIVYYHQAYLAQGLL